jgi:hypothetical protein
MFRPHFQIGLVFESVFVVVVVVAFQNVFHLEIHQNNIFFYFLKNYF